MKAFSSRIFGAVDRRYLVRAYIISAVIFLGAIWIANADPEAPSPPVAIYPFFLASAVLFPFAKLVWDEVADMLMGRNALFYGGAALAMKYVAKILVNVTLWWLALVVAPLGVLFLWAKTRNAY